MSDRTRQDQFQKLITVHNIADKPADEHFVQSVSLPEVHMPLDVYETDEAYITQLFAPTLRPEDLVITIGENVLTVEGLVQRLEEKAGGSDYSEMQQYSKFTCCTQFVIPIDTQRILVDFEQGTLTISMPKMNQAEHSE